MIDKVKLAQKEIKKGNIHKCRICGNGITFGDLKELNFEYVKTKLHETWCHSSCVNDEIYDKHVPRIN